jgi:hypothetical protein
MTIELNPIASGYSTTKINTNFDKVEAEFNTNVLRRNGLAVGEANQMEVPLDMNSFDILNVNNLDAQGFSIKGQSVDGFVQTAEEAATAASLSATNAAASAVFAETQAVRAEVAADSSDAVVLRADLANAIDPVKGAAILGRGVVSAATKPDIYSLPLSNKLVAVLAGQFGGEFYFSSANLSTQVLADPFEGVYIAPSVDRTGASGAWVRTTSGVINAGWFGIVGDSTNAITGTDNASRIQSALDMLLPVIIPRPPTGFMYGVSQLVLPRRTDISGPGMYFPTIIGISTSATVRAGILGTELKREVTLKDLNVFNNRGGDAVDIEFCPDFNFARVAFTSSTDIALGTTGKRGLNAKNCERGSFSGQCRFGGNPGLRLVKDCNSITGDRVVVSGGSGGLAVDISGCQQVRLPLTIETSLSGVRIGDNTGDNAINGGWCSGINLSDSYFESVGTPIVAGEGFAVSGLTLDNCWLNNGALAGGVPFPVSAECLRMGRVKSLRLRGGRWIGAGTEVALRALNTVATTGSAAGQLVLAECDLTMFESVASLLDSSLITNAANRGLFSGNNILSTDQSKAKGTGVDLDWTSDTLTANVGTLTLQLSRLTLSGGVITSVELIEGDGGSLSGARIRASGSTVLGEVLDYTFGAVNLTHFDFPLPATAILRPGDRLVFRLDAGTGGGKFRIRIKSKLSFA